MDTTDLAPRRPAPEPCAPPVLFWAELAFGVALVLPLAVFAADEGASLVALAVFLFLFSTPARKSSLSS
eukprot:7751454-Pyramimonas_sp.AAC.1